MIPWRALPLLVGVCTVLAPEGVLALAPRHVVVRVASDDPASWLGRLRGQTSDLAWEVVPAAIGSLEPDDAVRAVAAQTLADVTHADAVVWLVHPILGNAWEVHVYAARADRTVVRTLPEGLTETSALEAAALLVRGVLQALDEEGPVEPSAPLAEQPSSAPPPRAMRPRTLVGAFVGWYAAVDGQSPEGAQGVLARLVVAREHWVASLDARALLPVDLTTTLGVAHVSAAGVSAFAGARLLAGDFVEFAPGLHVGALGFHRATTSVRPGAVPSADDWIATPALGPEVRATFVPGRTGGYLGLTLGLGVDFVPMAPAYGDVVGGAFVASRALWLVQPFASLGLEVRTR